MSVHNRLLLNRLAVNGHRMLQVMLMIEPRAGSSIRTFLERLQGRVRRWDQALGYVRAEIPIDRLAELAAHPGVHAYQISSLSRGAWYRDAAPELNARLFRDFEIRAVTASPSDTSRTDLPRTLPEGARTSGYTADDDAGVGEWLSKYPTFDGRGVTIALLESAQPEFAHPAFGAAKALDGTAVSKIAGILNATDPGDPDDTRVDLGTRVRASSAWVPIGGRTYIVPRPGTYRFGVFGLPAGGNLVERFAVLRNEASREVRVDTDGDGDFQDEIPLAHPNGASEVRKLQLRHPERTELAFVTGEGREPHQLHIYAARSAHTTMTMGVAAAAGTPDGLARGVAPGARILLVRNSVSLARLHTFFEGFLDTMRRPDVDVLCASAGMALVPDTAHDFAGVFFRHLIATYRKPIFHSAGNSLRLLHGVQALGDVFSVGGSLGPASYAALYGGAPLDDIIVHPVSAAGPGLDGALEPDFLAPENLVAPGLLVEMRPALVPRNAPTARLPRGYVVSCCTSASAPYAAGLAALLLSAARQQRLSLDVHALGRALRASARFLPGWPAHQQGNGVLDVNAAWRELLRVSRVSRIRVAGENRHALTAYAARSRHGEGIFEREGWYAGATGRRILRFTRESGPTRAQTYRLSWTGNDGTFSTAASIALPLGTGVPLPVSVAVAGPGVHSAILNLHDSETDAIVHRAAVTIVASERFTPPDWTIRFTGSLPFMRTSEHFLEVPTGAAAINIELEVLSGAVSALVLPPHGLNAEYYDHIVPQAARTFVKGKYSILLPGPREGAWSVSVSNISGWLERDAALRSYGTANYTVSLKLLGAALDARTSRMGVTLAGTNLAAALREPAIRVSSGRTRSHRASFLPTGIANQFEIVVPEGADMLALRAQTTSDSALLELHLYDCTSGECFSFDFTMHPANTHGMAVKRPRSGRWVAAVSRAPLPRAGGSFVLDEIITTKKERQMAVGARRPSGAQWHDTFALQGGDAAGSGDRVFVFELVDLAVEREGREHPWETRQGQPALSDREIALGTAVLPMR